MFEDMDGNFDPRFRTEYVCSVGKAEKPEDIHFLCPDSSIFMKDWQFSHDNLGLNYRLVS